MATDDSHKDRIIEAIIVAALRPTCLAAWMELDQELPPLTPEERAALESLGPPKKFVARMMKEADRRKAQEN